MKMTLDILEKASNSTYKWSGLHFTKKQLSLIGLSWKNRSKIRECLNKEYPKEVIRDFINSKGTYTKESIYVARSRSKKPKKPNKYDYTNLKLCNKCRKEYCHPISNYCPKCNRRRIYRNGKFKQRYGIPYDIKIEWFEKSGRKCGICKNTIEDCGKAHLDHCHKNKEIRGLLCRDCNWALGYFKDNIDNLKNAIKYLKGQDRSKRILDKILSKNNLVIELNERY